jgi:phosphoadenosine phosphosulfate reductase
MLLEISSLNERFRQLSIEERICELYEIYDESEVLYTSSFGTSAVFLLFVLNKLRPTQKIHFIDTGFHFQETMDYKAELTACYNLNIENIAFDEHINYGNRKKIRRLKYQEDIDCPILLFFS